MEKSALRVAGYELRVTWCELRVTGSSIADLGFRILDFGFREARLRVAAPTAKADSQK